MADMSWYLSGELMPKFSSMQEIVMPNAKEILTLDGTLYVDFVNVRRGWKFGFKLLKAEDYKKLRDKFDAQFNTPIFHYVTIPEYDIYQKVYMKINDKNIKYNGSIIEGVEVELYEQYAVS